MNPIKKIYNLGVYQELDLAKRKKIRLINLISMVAIGTAILSIIYAITNVGFIFSTFMSSLFAVISHATCLVLNKKGSYKGAAWILIIHANISIVAIIFLLEQDHGPFHMLVCTFIMYVIFLEKRVQIYLMSFMTISIILTGIYLQQNGTIVPLNIYASHELFPVKAVHFVVMVVLVLMLTMFMRSTSRLYESELEEMVALNKMQNEKLKLNLSTNETLLAEIHHRVKNNLQLIISLLDLQTDRTTDDKQLKILTDNISRITSMAMIHKTLYENENFSSINVGEYLQELISSIISLQEEDITLNANFDLLLFDLDNTVPLGLILNELVTNSIKYGINPGKENVFHFKLIKDKDLVQIVFKDSGPGYSEEDVSKDSLGLSLVSMLTRQLKGKSQRQNDNGSMTSIYLDLNKLSINAN